MTMQGEAPADQSVRGRRRTTPLVITGVAVCLVIGLVLGVRWWTHPNVLPDMGGTMSAAPRPVADAALAFAVTWPTAGGDPTTLTWHGARATLATNTARAEVAFTICQVRPAQVDAGMFYMWPVRGLSKFCSALHPIRPGMRLTYPDRHQSVLMTLTPTRPGAVHLTGIEVSYALGADHFFRRGTDNVALDAHFFAR